MYNAQQRGPVSRLFSAPIDLCGCGTCQAQKCPTLQGGGGGGCQGVTHPPPNLTQRQNMEKKFFRRLGRRVKPFKMTHPLGGREGGASKTHPPHSIQRGRTFWGSRSGTYIEEDWAVKLRQTRGTGAGTDDRDVGHTHQECADPQGVGWGGVRIQRPTRPDLETFLVRKDENYRAKCCFFFRNTALQPALDLWTFAHVPLSLCRPPVPIQVLSPCRVDYRACSAHPHLSGVTSNRHGGGSVPAPRHRHQQGGPAKGLRRQSV